MGGTFSGVVALSCAWALGFPSVGLCPSQMRRSVTAQNEGPLETSAEHFTLSISPEERGLPTAAISLFVLYKGRWV